MSIASATADSSSEFKQLNLLILERVESSYALLIRRCPRKVIHIVRSPLKFLSDNLGSCQVECASRSPGDSGSSGGVVARDGGAVVVGDVVGVVS